MLPYLHYHSEYCSFPIVQPQQWGFGNTPNVIFYPVSFTRFIVALIANDVGNGNSAIGCTRSGLNAFFPTATNGNDVGLTYISIGI